jgi:enamine deaminase RidA (YjgF/YER057c/UK114 family)
VSGLSVGRASDYRPPVTDRIPSSSRFASTIGFSAAAAAGPLVFTAGFTAVGPDGTLVGDGAYEQAREALRKLVEALAAAGAGPSDVVQTRMYLVSAGDWSEVGRAHAEVLGAARPAATMVVVAQLLDPRMLVEIEAVAYRSGS